MSGLSRTPGKRVYGESRTVGSNPTLSANKKTARSGCFFIGGAGCVDEPAGSTSDTRGVSRRTLRQARRSRA